MFKVGKSLIYCCILISIILGSINLIFYKNILADELRICCEGTSGGGSGCNGMPCNEGASMFLEYSYNECIEYPVTCYDCINQETRSMMCKTHYFATYCIKEDNTYYYGYETK